MTVIEIIFAVLLILSCVFIIAVVLMQESKQGMSNVISGGSTDNYFQKNSGRTKEAKLSRATKIAAVIVFVVAIAVNLISVYWGGESDADTSSVVYDDDLNSELLDSISIDTDTAGEDADEAQDADADETEAADGAAAEQEPPQETEAEDTAEAADATADAE